MKMFLWSKLILSMCMFTMIQSPLQARALSDYKWKMRPVLVFASPSSHRKYKEQMRILNGAKAELEERDVVVLVDTEMQTPTDLRSAFSPDGFLFVLVGKDGGVKYESREPVSIIKLMSLIDAMPMRQREMQQN